MRVSLYHIILHHNIVTLYVWKYVWLVLCHGNLLQFAASAPKEGTEPSNGLRKLVLIPLSIPMVIKPNMEEKWYMIK